MKFNPFRPGLIIHTGMFAGRADEMRALEQALHQTANGNPAHFLIHGERGIGKSSLLMLMNATAIGSVTSFDEDRTYKFLTVNIELEPSDTYAEIIGKVARELDREINKREDITAILKSVWDFVSKWKVLGVEYKGGSLPPTKAMLEELGDKLVLIADKIKSEYQGIYIFIDEADKPEAEADLGEFVKVLSERLTKRKANNVGIGVIGISTVIEKMKKSHESSVRILMPISLDPLLVDDRADVVIRGLNEAAKTNGFATAISPDALSLIATLSEGYPHFIQQYAYSAFAQDSDNAISVEDVRTALSKEGGALQLLGQRFFENMYTDELRSDDYRKVLQVLARHMPEYVSRKTIIAESGLKYHTVNNALGACKKKGSVLQQKGQVGHFRLPSNSFAAWIQAFKVA
jgi:hypothetical protein